jgi:hypothetical protein
MASEITGGCRCGQLRYRFEQDGPLLNYCCHCLDCQKSTGSAFADQVVVMIDVLRVEGRSVTSSLPRPSGGLTTAHFCPDCFSRVHSINSERPGMAIVRGGSLDDPMLAEPFTHMWVKRKRRWIGLPDHLPVFEETPDAAEFMRLAVAPRQR